MIKNKFLNNPLVKDIILVTKAIIVSAVFVLMSISIYSYLNGQFRTEEAYYNDGFKGLPDNSIDAIVLGSSHAQYSFLPPLFYQKTGLYSYVLGTACQPYEVSFEMLKEALKTQSPKLVIMEAFTGTPFAESCLTEGCYVMASYQMSGEEKDNTLSYIDKDKANEYRNIFLSNHNNWRNYDSFKQIFEKYEPTLADTKSEFGYQWNYPEFPTANYWDPLLYDVTNDVKLDDIDLIMLNNIKELCDQNDIKFMMYMVPFDGIRQIDHDYRFAIWNWCKENDVLYQDQVQDAPDMRYWMQIHNDGSHAYINGAALTTSYLSDFVNNNYEIDHTEIDELTDKYLLGNGTTLLDAFKYEYDPLNYGKYFKGYKGTVLIRYNKNDQKISKEFRNYLYDLGVEKGFQNNDNYYALINDGVTENILFEEGSFEFKNRTFEIRSEEIYLDDEPLGCQGDLTLVIFNNSFNGHVTKNISYQNDMVWEYGYTWYGE